MGSLFVTLHQVGVFPTSAGNFLVYRLTPVFPINNANTADHYWTKWSDQQRFKPNRKLKRLQNRDLVLSKKRTILDKRRERKECREFWNARRTNPLFSSFAYFSTNKRRNPNQQLNEETEKCLFWGCRGLPRLQKRNFFSRNKSPLSPTRRRWFPASFSPQGRSMYHNRHHDSPRSTVSSCSRSRSRSPIGLLCSSSTPSSWW